MVKYAVIFGKVGDAMQLKYTKSVLIICLLLLFCTALAVGAATRLPAPLFTPVYYEQNNDRGEHLIYFYLIRNREDGRGEPFRFCFPEDATIHCTLQPVRDCAAYSRQMMEEQGKWQRGKRYYGRYMVELLELRFTVPEQDVQQGPLELHQGKVYFHNGYYQNLHLGLVRVHPAGARVSASDGQELEPMTNLSVGNVVERPYFADTLQVWRYVRASQVIYHNNQKTGTA